MLLRTIYISESVLMATFQLRKPHGGTYRTPPQKYNKNSKDDIVASNKKVTDENGPEKKVLDENVPGTLPDTITLLEDAFAKTMPRAVVDILKELTEVHPAAESSDSLTQAMAEQTVRADAFRRHVYDTMQSVTAEVDKMVADAERVDENPPEWFLANQAHMRDFPRRILGRMSMDAVSKDALLTHLAEPSFTRETIDSGSIDPQSVDVSIFSIGALEDVDAFVQDWPHPNTFTKAFHEELNGNEGNNFNTFIKMMNMLTKEKKLEEVVENMAAEIIASIELRKTLDRARDEQRKDFADIDKRKLLREAMWSSHGYVALQQETGETTLTRNAIDLVYGVNWVEERLDADIDVEKKAIGNERYWLASEEMSKPLEGAFIEFLSLVQNRDIVAQRAGRITEMFPQSPLPSTHLQMDAFLCPLFDAMAAALTDPDFAHSSYLSENQRERAERRSQRNMESVENETAQQINNIGLLDRSILRNWASIIEEILRVHNIQMPEDYHKETLFEYMVKLNKQVVALHIIARAKKDNVEISKEGIKRLNALWESLLTMSTMLPASIGSIGTLAIGMAVKYFFPNLVEVVEPYINSHTILILSLAITPAIVAGTSWINAMTNNYENGRSKAIQNAARVSANQLITVAHWYFFITTVTQMDGEILSPATTNGTLPLAIWRLQENMATFVTVGFVAKQVVERTRLARKGDTRWREIDIWTALKLFGAFAHIAWLFPGPIAAAVDQVRNGLGGNFQNPGFGATVFIDGVRRLVGRAGITLPEVVSFNGFGSVLADRFVSIAEQIEPFKNKLATGDNIIPINDLANRGIVLLTGTSWSFWRVVQTLAGNAFMFIVMREQWLRTIDDLAFLYATEIQDEGALNLRTFRAHFAMGLVVGGAISRTLADESLLRDPTNRHKVQFKPGELPTKAALNEIVRGLGEVERGYLRLAIERARNGSWNIKNPVDKDLQELLVTMFEGSSRGFRLIKQAFPITEWDPKPTTSYISRHLLRDRSFLNIAKVLTLLTFSNAPVEITELFDPLIRSIMRQNMRNPPRTPTPAEKRAVEISFHWHKIAIFTTTVLVAGTFNVLPSYFPRLWLPFALAQWPMLYYGESVLRSEQEAPKIVFRDQ